jgi:hypothetical protein
MSGENLNKSNRYIKLNVGGRLFVSSIDTLTKQDNMFRAMFSGRMEVITDSDGIVPMFFSESLRLKLLLLYLKVIH